MSPGGIVLWATFKNIFAIPSGLSHFLNQIHNLQIEKEFRNNNKNQNHYICSLHIKKNPTKI